MKLLYFIGILTVIGLSLSSPASACTDCCQNPVINNNITVSNILSQVQWMTQQQSQEQHQEQHIESASGTQGSWISASSSGNGNGDGKVFEQESQTYSRLVYPGEVVLFPVNGSKTCTLLSGLPVAFYAIPAGHGYYEFMVGSSEATPTYDPIYHHMDFGHVPVHDKVDYWTMKAKLDVSPDAAFCIVDNRAPMNGYTTIEVVVK